MALRVPLRQLGTGLPSLGSLDIPIEANPVADAVETATKLLIGTKVWAFGGGTEVVANPGGTGLLTLSTITIDGVSYAISGMGGGGGSDGVTESIDFAQGRGYDHRDDRAVGRTDGRDRHVRRVQRGLRRPLRPADAVLPATTTT